MSSTTAKSIFFRLGWRDTTLEGSECKTVAAVTVFVDDMPVWPTPGEATEDFEWFVDELLAHLTECWKPLILRQTYPISIQPERPSYIFAEAQKRWSTLPEATVESEGRELAAFEDVHNIANAFGGITGLLPLWFVRDQDEMTIDTRTHYFRIPLDAAIEALSAVGDQIATRLQDADRFKWIKLIEAWHSRNEADETQLLALTIGRDRETAATLIHDKILEAPTSVAAATHDRDELRIAARMAGPLPVNQIRFVLQKVRDCDPLKAPKLETAMKAAVDFIDSQGMSSARPFVQGSELAKWLRRYLKLSDDRKIDPTKILERDFGVDVRYIDLGLPSLDAIAVWGPKHGPAALLNSKSARIRPTNRIWEHGATRVTAAHEMCHFLLDSKHTLSAVDVLGGRMPIRIEQRAKAFAAEFLLPNKEAAAIWHRAETPLDIDELRVVIGAICQKYGVTESVASWQLEHGVEQFYQEPLARVLDQLVPQR
jgi:hypothetical protein